AALLRGLFTASGSVVNLGDKHRYIALDSVSLEFLKQIQLMLLSFGIKSKLYENRRIAPGATPQLHTLHICKSSRIIFQREIGFLPLSRKSEELQKLNRIAPSGEDVLVDPIESLTLSGVEDVYDLTEPKTSHFVADGLMVHNCSEYMFLDDTACNLASL